MQVAKTKQQISCAINVQLICAFCLDHIRFPHDAAQICNHLTLKLSNFMTFFMLKDGDENAVWPVQ